MAVGSKLNVDGAGRDLVAGDVSIGAGYGTGPTLTIEAGSNGAAGHLSIEAEATPAADAEFTVTFPEAYDRAPVVIVNRQDEDQAAGDFRVKTRSATSFTVVFEGTPVANEVYECAYVVVGK
jgi:hypothetical protein